MSLLNCSKTIEKGALWIFCLPRDAGLCKDRTGPSYYAQKPACHALHFKITCLGFCWSWMYKTAQCWISALYVRQNIAVFIRKHCFLLPSSTCQQRHYDFRIIILICSLNIIRKAIINPQSKRMNSSPFTVYPFFRSNTQDPSNFLSPRPITNVSNLARGLRIVTWLFVFDFAESNLITSCDRQKPSQTVCCHSDKSGHREEAGRKVPELVSSGCTAEIPPYIFDAASLPPPPQIQTSRQLKDLRSTWVELT